MHCRELQVETKYCELQWYKIFGRSFEATIAVRGAYTESSERLARNTFDLVIVEVPPIVGDQCAWHPQPLTYEHLDRYY